MTTPFFPLLVLVLVLEVIFAPLASEGLSEGRREGVPGVVAGDVQHPHVAVARQRLHHRHHQRAAEPPVVLAAEAQALQPQR